jgi:hypothetical protein
MQFMEELVASPHDWMPAGRHVHGYGVRALQKDDHLKHVCDAERADVGPNEQAKRENALPAS